jgi:hypothetical protein
MCKGQEDKRNDQLVSHKLVPQKCTLLNAKTRHLALQFECKKSLVTGMSSLSACDILSFHRLGLSHVAKLH